MEFSVFSFSINFGWELPIPGRSRVSISEISRRVNERGIVEVSFEIYNNSNDLICVRKVESPLEIKWFEGPQVFVLGNSGPYQLKQVSEPFCFPVDIAEKEKKSFVFSFRYPNQDAKLSLKKASWGYSSEYVLHLK